MPSLPENFKIRTQFDQTPRNQALSLICVRILKFRGRQPARGRRQSPKVEVSMT